MLADSVLDWPADFGGDLVLTQGGQPMALGPRTQAEAGMVDGRVFKGHVRVLATPIVPEPSVTLQN